MSGSQRSSEGVQTGYLAPAGFLPQLRTELGDSVVDIRDRLVIAAGPPQPVAWTANVWHDPQRIEVESIGAAARKLRAIQRNWALYSTSLHRRAALIQDKLPHVSARPLRFPDPAPRAPLGSWTLLDAHTILAAPRCDSPFPHGEARFVEDREHPPSRAYLKLFEALTLLDQRPGPGDTCIDLGASPGGWTWALQQTGARVLAVDRAALAPTVAHLPNVEFQQGNAFTLPPRPVDWLFCDVACYPERLLELVERWRPVCPRMVCTIKFQGATDHAITRRFAAVENSRLRHLHHNKHELTWTRTE